MGFNIFDDVIRKLLAELLPVIFPSRCLLSLNFEDVKRRRSNKTKVRKIQSTLLKKIAVVKNETKIIVGLLSGLDNQKKD